MKRNFRMLFGAVLLLFVGNFSAAAADMTDFQKAVLSPTRDIALPIQYRDTRFWLFLPKGYGQENQNWPVLMYLHGSHRRGTDLRKVRTNVPAPFMEQAGELPFIVVAPQCPKGERWDPDELIALLDKLITELAIDTTRIYLTGMSLGAFGTFEVAAKYPNRFAAIAPISGGGNDKQVAALSNMPAWVFHGTNDKVVPFSRSSSMVNALKEVGAEVKFTAFKGQGHDIWTEAYSNPELYSWLLEHRRTTGRQITYSVPLYGKTYQPPRQTITPPAETAKPNGDAVADVIRGLERNRSHRTPASVR